jgi:hypothetical protein
MARLRSVVHDPEVVLGVLVAILHLDGIAVEGRFTSQRQVALIIAMRIARAVVVLTLRAVAPAGLLRSPPLWSLVTTVAICYHSVGLQ